MTGYQSWLAARGYRRVTVLRSSFGECDSGRHPQGEDLQGLSGEAMPERAAGIAQKQSGAIQ